MARAAFIMDKLLHRTGLSGRSFVPMLMGFGCSVPGVMAARTLENERDRRMTIMLTPFMSCSAKMPVYALFIAAFFPAVPGSGGVRHLCHRHRGGGGVRHDSEKKPCSRGACPFVMELPPYRLPTVKTLGMHLYERVKDFCRRAGTILVAASVVVWFLQSFDSHLQMLPAGHTEESLLAGLGKDHRPDFLLALGFGFWQAAVALLSGFVAKEAVVER